MDPLIEKNNEIVPEYWKNLSLENIIYFNEDDIECVEEWRDVKGYEGLYMVSDCGRIKSFHSLPKIIKQFKNYKGYVTVTLTKEIGVLKTKVVHILVGLAFIPNPTNRPQVNHIKGIKWYNPKWNLEWNTNGENGRHARRTGLCKQIAETASSAILTNKEVIEIFNSDLPQSELCKIYDATDCTISNIKTGRKWSSVTGKVFMPKKLDKSLVLEIFNSILKTKEIQEKYNVNEWTVREIKSGKRWSETTGKKKYKEVADG